MFEGSGGMTERGGAFNGLGSAMKTQTNLKERIVANKGNVIVWGGFFAFVLFVYHFLSDGDFSFLLTLGGIARCFAMVNLTLKFSLQKSCAGVSLKTLQLYSTVFFFRLCSILVYEGYLPFDRSGDWLYQTVEVVALGLTCINIFFVVGPFKTTYTRHLDTFGMFKMVPSWAGIVWFVVPCALFAALLHPTLNGNYFTDVAWTMACYLETFAMVPQLYLFNRTKKAEGTVEDFTSHFVFALGIARFMNFLFWMSSYHELNDTYTGGYVGYVVLIFQFLQLIIMGQYFYNYLKSAATGGPMQLPQYTSAV